MTKLHGLRGEALPSFAQKRDHMAHERRVTGDSFPLDETVFQAKNTLENDTKNYISKPTEH